MLASEFSRLTARPHQAVVHPVLRERLPVARFRLRDFVFVMWKEQIEPAAVNVERLPEVLHAHRRAFDMPARTTGSPGAVPCRLARPGSLPHGEVGRVAFAVAGFDASSRQHFVDASPAQFAVIVIPLDLKVDVTIERISMAVFDERADHLEHLVDVLGGFWKPVNRVDAHGLEVFEVIVRHLLGEGFDRGSFFSSLVDEFVINVGDVDDPVDRIARVFEISFDRIEDDRPDHVPDMCRLVNRRPAQIHADLAWLDRFKILFCPGQRVVDSQWHGE